jgi:hypothetical protein
MLIYGEIEDTSGCVSLVDAFIVSERLTNAGESQKIRARYALTSPVVHVEPGDMYVKLILELSGLESWSKQGGLEQYFSSGEVSVRAYEPPRDRVALQDGAGELALGVSFGKRGSGPISMEVWRKISYFLTGLNPQPLDKLVVDFVEPLRDITSLCTDSKTNIRSVKVAASDLPDRIISVYGPTVWDEIDDDEDRTSNLLEFSSIGLAGIARWLSLHRVVEPLGSLVADARFSSDADLSTRVFQLASAAEGLHRRFYDDEPRIDKNVARVVRRAAKRIFSRFEPDILAAVTDGLVFIGQPTFAQRLTRLMREVRGINSAVFGSDPDKWIQKVKSARNQVAHQLHGKDSLPEREQIVMVNSLYWVLAVLMLYQCGVSTHDLSMALSKNRRFRGFLRQGEAWMPDVYGHRVTG